MLLATILSAIEQTDDALCIGMVKPWDFGAPCCLIKLTDDCRWPDEEEHKGFRYFLEISTAKEVLEGCGPPLFSLEEQVAILIYYAENDAWPEWMDAKLRVP